MVKEFFSVTLILFSVIDIVGSLPVVVDIKNRVGALQVMKTTLAAGALMITFLLIGDSVLHLLGTDVNAFAIAGGIVILLIGLEMVLGIRIFKTDPEECETSSIVPIAFPLIAGRGNVDNDPVAQIRVCSNHDLLWHPRQPGYRLPGPPKLWLD